MGLAAAQWSSYVAGQRTSVLTTSSVLLGLGAVLIAGGVLLWVAASMHCQRAANADGVATSGPFAVIRHPIYVSMYLLCTGLGLVFFTWLHVLVLVAFAPLWWLACRREEQEIREAHGEGYVDYQARTSMVIPGIL